MILYHGTDASFHKPLLEKCLSYKDFGKGFYLTEKLAMAKQWGERKNAVKYKVNLYEADDDFLVSAEREGLIIKQFKANSYDIVVGPVANSKIESHFARIKRREATFEEIARTLPYNKFNAIQICLCSERSLELIKYKERYGYPK